MISIFNRSRLAVLSLSAYILSYPIYLFDSGGPQLSLVFLVVFLVLALRLSDCDFIISVSFFKVLLWFVVYSGVVNTFFSIAFESFEPVKYSIYYVLNLLLCAGVYVLGRCFSLPRFVVLIFSLSLVSQLFLSMIFIPEVVAGRFQILFNNPNQLAYFSLLSILIISYFFESSNFKRIVLFCLFFCAGYLIFITTSKAAMVGFLFFIVLWNIFRVRDHKMKSWILSALVVLSSGYIANNMIHYGVCSNKGVDIKECYFESGSLSQHNLVLPRLSSIGSDADDSFVARGYDRILESPSYLLIGAGEGLFDRFRGGGELHSIPGTLIFSYGVLGLAFLIFISYLVLAKGGLGLLLYIVPLLPYAMTHNGFRSPLLWLLVLFLVIDHDKIANDYCRNRHSS